MPLKKISLRPGVNRENTRYTTEGGWYDCDKIRFRQGTPEKIGGWARISANYFEGICRSLWNWVTLAGLNLIGVGTNLKLYVNRGGAYYNITPVRTRDYTASLSNPFDTTSASIIVTVNDTAHGAQTGDLVYFTGSAAVGGIPAIQLNSRHVITYIDANSYTITVTTPAGSTVTGGGGVVAADYVLNTNILGSNPFAITTGSRTVVVSDTAHGATLGSFVTFTGATESRDVLMDGEYQITRIVDQDSYEVEAHTAGTSTGSNGGSDVRAEYQINVGAAFAVSGRGWGAGTWGSGLWGFGTASTISLRTWTQGNYGQNLVAGYRGSPIYYWDAETGSVAPSFRTVNLPPSPFYTVLNSTTVRCTIYVSALRVGDAVTFAGTSTVNGLSLDGSFVIQSVDEANSFVYFDARAIATGTGTGGGSSATATYTVYNATPAVDLSTVAGASSVPVTQNYLIVSDTSRFLIAFGSNDYGTNDANPMLVRWSDQDNVTEWSPAVTNQAGSQILSTGSEIITAVQTRQEIVVFTDSALYSMQYVGAPYVWSFSLLGTNTSIVSQNAAAYASGVVYWMGKDKFYAYDGRVNTLNCDLRKFVFEDINHAQYAQVFSGTNEAFNEVWWFYCSNNSNFPDRYVVFNYLESVWYYGTMDRSAWLDTGLQASPLAATADSNLVFQEVGNDDNTTGTPVAIDSYITSAQFDIEDGHNFSFIYRVIPDVSFVGSTGTDPSITMYLQPLTNSGSGFNDPESVGGSNNAAVTRTATVPVEQFTGQVYIRVRGRQMAMKIRSTDLGVQWQLGAPRIDIRPDGRAGGSTNG
jgi:hypothetical protein